MKNRRAGVTLLEVMIASGILVVVVAMAMVVLTSGTGTASRGRLMSEQEQRANRTLAFFRDQISTAVFSKTSYTKLGFYPWWGTGSANLGVGYQIAGQTTIPASGSFSTGNGSITFGYPDPHPDPHVTGYDTTTTNQSQPVKANYACFIRFEADTVYKESSSALTPTQAVNWTDPALPAYPSLVDDGTGLIVQTLNMDLNGNGNRNDTFVSGKLVKYVIDTTQSSSLANCVVSRERLDDQVLMCVNSANPGDFTGSVLGSAYPRDYLFCLADATGTANPALNMSSNPAPTSLKVDLWHGCRDQDGKRFILRQNSILIHFRPELIGAPNP